MINSKSHTKEWLEEKKKDFPKRDPSLIEKVIKALTLVEQLKLSGLDFTFKGGTSLILLLSEQKRFSIDIDILTTVGGEELEKHLNKVVSFGVFKSFEENKRTTANKVPKRHFKLFYDPLVSSSAPGSILLDVLEEKSHYAQCAEVQVKSPIVFCDGDPTSVIVPTVDSILGDKLTAFAPTTTGILYGKEKSLEIAKQLFDVGHLFDECKDLEQTRATFKKIAEIELGYRNKADLKFTDVLEDTFSTAAIITHRGKTEETKYKELEDGAKKLSAFILSGKFQIEDAIGCASRAAYLSELLHAGGAKAEKFTDKTDLASLKIEGTEYSRFNKLRSYRPDAFFYWSLAIGLRQARLKE